MNSSYTTEHSTIRLSIPLLTRLLEYAREESPSDVDLHWILERIIDVNDIGYVLTMSHYDRLIPSSRLVTVEVNEDR